ncbi:MAG: hypothetical protein ABI761_01315 [Saprospiraceae bacterium]
MNGFKALAFFVFSFSKFYFLSGQTFKPLSSEERTAIQKYEDTLATLARGILNSELPENRMFACHQFIPTLVHALKINNSFKYHFPRLENISMIYPPDSTFRIFSWQLQINPGEYKYYGAIQYNQPNLRLTPLVDRSETIPDATLFSSDADKWYGVVYYNIKSFPLSNKETGYLLFGYDGYTINEHRKIIDNLSFKNGQPVFGSSIFKYGKEGMKNRVVYQYDVNAAIRVNYDENESMVVCDHLMVNPGILSKEGKTMVPEGSYEGFKLDKGVWKYIEEVFPSNSADNQRAYTTKPGKAKETKPKN